MSGNIIPHAGEDQEIHLCFAMDIGSVEINVFLILNSDTVHNIKDGSLSTYWLYWADYQKGQFDERRRSMSWTLSSLLC